jgi:hypothetical protein
MDTPLVITYDNAPTENTKYFLQTLEKNKWNYKLIGEGEKWEGFTSKLKGYANYIKTLDPNQLIIVSDARDVVCLRGPKAFVKGFKSFNKEIVVSMEQTCCGIFNPPLDSKCVQCVHLTEYWKHYKINDLPDRKFVNSGLVAGKAASVLDWLEWSLTNKFTDDQLALGTYINTFPQKVGLDTNAIILHTSTFGINAGIQSIHVQKNDSPTFAELFGRGAFFLHISGIGGKGQGCIYEYVKLMLSSGANNERLSSLYKYNEPDWDEVF